MKKRATLNLQSDSIETATLQNTKSRKTNRDYFPKTGVSNVNECASAKSRLDSCLDGHLQHCAASPERQHNGDQGRLLSLRTTFHLSVSFVVRSFVEQRTKESSYLTRDPQKLVSTIRSIRLIGVSSCS